jgi:hypothetical protein
LVVDALRAMYSLRPDGARAVDDPVGPQRIERPAAERGSLHALRPQGRVVALAQLEELRLRLRDVPGRPMIEQNPEGPYLPPVDKVSEYLQHAEECRRMARAASNPEHATALLQMAQTWTDLASARAEVLERARRIAALDSDKGEEGQR